MTSIPALDELQNPADDDVLAIADVSAGITKKIEIAKLSGQQGNVLRFGADPTGTADSATAIQAAVDSDYPVYFPPGDYRIDTTITVSTPKLIYAGGSILRSSTLYEQVRIFTTSDINMFEIQVWDVWGFGGMFDMSGASNGTKAAFYYPLEANGTGAGGVGDAGGWGGGWQDFVILGNEADLATATGSDGIHFDFAGSSVDNAYWTKMYFRGDIEGCNRAFYASDKNPAVTQWSNSFTLHLKVRHCKQALVNTSINRVRLSGYHQARHIFGSQAESQAAPSVYSRTKDNHWDYFVMHDFSGAQVGSLWTNTYTWDIDSPDDNDMFTGPFVAGSQVLGLHGVIMVGNEWASGVCVESSANLSDITSFINTAGFKREGYQVKEASGIPLYAAGTAAGDVWEDATGATVRTPV